VGVLALLDLRCFRLGRCSCPDGRRDQCRCDDDSSDSGRASSDIDRLYPSLLHRGSDRLACPEGLEPPTCCLEGNCSIQLSYGQRGPSFDDGLVGAAGFELATYWSQTSCATRLRYAPNGAIVEGALRVDVVSAPRRRRSAPAASAGARSRRTAGCAARRRSAAPSR